ncbi:MAG: LysR family transcriptional regulator [Synergistaceae bacterium]|nr:LysR family transcriptional regulator [Synergistaceae bacterium]
MELRLLRYFFEAAREGNITRAAEKIHITQPSLSRQLALLEAELGRELYVRDKNGIRLTEYGLLLMKRAEEMLALEGKILDDLSGGEISGTVYIGAGETAGVKHIGKVIRELRRKYPGIRYRMISGDAEDVADKLGKGLIDFGLFVGKVKLRNYDCIPLPYSDRWGAILRDDDELAGHEYISPDDLKGRELLFSHQAYEQGEFSEWLGYSPDSLNIIGTHNLAYNASMMVCEGLGMLITIEGIISTGNDTGLRFIPLMPEMKAGLVLASKHGAVLSKAASKFLEALKASLPPNHKG